MIEDFKRSDGFVSKFIKINGLKFGVMVGKASKVDKLICEIGKINLTNVLQGTMLKIYLTGMG